MTNLIVCEMPDNMCSVDDPCTEHAARAAEYKIEQLTKRVAELEAAGRAALAIFEEDMDGEEPAHPDVVAAYRLLFYALAPAVCVTCGNDGDCPDCDDLPFKHYSNYSDKRSTPR